MKWNEATVFFLIAALLFFILGVYELLHINLISALFAFVAVYLCMFLVDIANRNEG